MKKTLDFLERNKRHIFVVSALTFILFVFENKLIKVFDKYLLPFIDIHTNIFTGIFFFIMLVYPILAIIKCLKNKYIRSYYVIGLISFYLYIYFKFRFSDKYLYTPFICKISYTDVIVLLLTIYVCVCVYNYIYSRIKKLEKTENSYYILDEALKNCDGDILGYTYEAKELVKLIKSISPEASCSIGLVAPWGAGKTSYLNFVEELINKEKDKFIVIKFNPRHSNDANSIQKDFFYTLSSKLKEFNSSFSTLFKEYMESIGIIDKRFSNIFLSLHKIWNKESEKEKINSALKLIKKRVIIFIEDLDRLVANEIMEVFKLIDGNASFKNIIFITAYEREYINKIIKSHSNDQHNFVDKFFTLEIPIPLVNYNTIFNYLKDLLLTNLPTRLEKILSDEEKNNYIEIISEHKDLHQEYLPTIRDVKRFLNSFLHKYKFVEGEVIFEEYYLLSMFKYRHPEEYKKLQKGEYLKNDLLSIFFELNEESKKEKFSDILGILFPENNYESSNNYTSFSPDPLKTENPKNDYKSIRKKESFDNYFYNSINGLRLKDLNRLLDMNPITINNQLHEWDNSKNDIIQFVDNKTLDSFSNKTQFFNFIDLCFLISTKYLHIPHITTQFFNKVILKKIFKKHNINERDYRNELKKRFSKVGYYSDKYPIDLANNIMHKLIIKELSEPIFSREDMLDCIKKAPLKFIVFLHPK